MKLKLSSALLFILSAFFFFSCEREISFENGGGVITPTGPGSSTGTAIYTYDGGAGTCTGAVVNGTYTAGIALTSANAVMVTVNVDSVGTYSITTNTVNGVYFQATGTFASTGVQTITFAGSGTPSAAGSFNFTPGTTGCTFSISVNPTSTAVTDYYFDVTIDGTRIIKHADETATGYNVGYGYSGFDTVAYSSSISPTTSPSPLNMPYIEISKGLFNGYFNATESAFKNFFLPGTYPFAIPDSYQGIYIIWVDKDLKIWQTNFAPGTQTGSSFNIASAEDYHDILGDYIVKFTATFNCKLYDDAGNSITLTNGKYVGEFNK